MKRKARIRSTATTVLEIAGAAMIVFGIYELTGIGWAAIAAGAGAIGISYLVVRG